MGLKDKKMQALGEHLVRCLRYQLRCLHPLWLLDVSILYPPGLLTAACCSHGPWEVKVLAPIIESLPVMWEDLHLVSACLSLSKHWGSQSIAGDMLSFPLFQATPLLNN